MLPGTATITIRSPLLVGHRRSHFHTHPTMQVLKSKPLRSYAGTLSYHDPKTYSTPDAMRIGRLHCLRPGKYHRCALPVFWIERVKRLTTPGAA